MSIMEQVRKKLRSFLRIENPQTNIYTLSNLTDYETECIINKVWSWGDKEAIEQLYKQLTSGTTSLNFWAATPSLGIVKRHTGIPGVITKTLTDIVVSDMNDIQVEEKHSLKWEEILKDIEIEDLISEAIKETLVNGDGAFRVAIDTEVSKYPIVEFVPGDQIEYRRVRGKIKEIVFKSPINYNHKRYLFEETYGYGYIKSKLYDGDNEIPLKSIPILSELEGNVEYPGNFIMAVPLMFFKSDKFKGRGRSIYTGKHDSFDSLDEIWSEWMDAARKAMTKEYIPEGLMPRDPKTGALLKYNDFDHQFIATESPMNEGKTNKIETVQPSIPHESYLATYITALDLCLQGIISPSSLGIDTKKLDNAEAQREKEKTTLYTRNKVVSTLQKAVPELVDIIFKTYETLNKNQIYDVKSEITFGEYANPSFESQVETVGKAKTQGIMSIEASVEELYGDTKDKTWKDKEVERLKKELGVAEVEEPSVDADNLNIV